MILSGFETQQNYHLNNINLLKDSNYLKYNLNNRVDDDGNIIQWGNSVIIGIDNTRGNTIVAGDNITIFSLDDSIEWLVKKVTDHWILISIISTDGSINFNDYYNSKLPSSDNDYRIKQNSTIRFIRKAEISKNYQNLNVQMKSLDTLDQPINFGDMNIKVDLNGGIIVYNLSLSFFIELQDKNIEGVLFDLCVKSDDYRPIIRGLKFEEKVRDLDYLVFSHYTNEGKQYIIFTTKNIISEYSVYPDIYISDNLYNNIANDYRVPSLFNNMMNDIYSTEFISLYTSSDSINESILDSNISYCREVIEGDIIYYMSEVGDVETRNRFDVGSEYLGGELINGTLNIISYDSKMLIYSNDENEIKEQNLTNLLLEFTTPINYSLDREFRILQVYYKDAGSREELLYQCYLPLTTIFAEDSKTFRIII